MATEFLDRPVSMWISASVVAATIIVGVPLIRLFISRRFDPKRHPPTTVSHLIGRLSQRWMKLTTTTCAIAAGVLILKPDDPGTQIAHGAIIAACALQAMVLVGAVADWVIQRVTRRAHARAVESAHGTDLIITEEDTRTTLMGLRWVVLLGCYIVIVLLALNNLGVNITAMVAGLGIGGVAIALALQNVLGDLFASLTIALDKPFVIGDFIVAGNEMGTIENIGLKTTRVRSLSGEQLVFANSDLLSSRIRNFKRMRQRRVQHNFALVYDTPAEKLEHVGEIVKKCVEGRPHTKFDRCHMTKFADSAIAFELVYFIDSPDSAIHMDTQQAILIAMVRAFDEEDIHFALPAQSVVQRPMRRARSAESQAHRKASKIDDADLRRTHETDANDDLGTMRGRSGDENGAPDFERPPRAW